MNLIHASIKNTGYSGPMSWFLTSSGSEPSSVVPGAQMARMIVVSRVRAGALAFAALNKTTWGAAGLGSPGLV